MENIQFNAQVASRIQGKPISPHITIRFFFNSLASTFFSTIHQGRVELIGSRGYVLSDLSCFAVQWYPPVRYIVDISYPLGNQGWCGNRNCSWDCSGDGCGGFGLDSTLFDGSRHFPMRKIERNSFGANNIAGGI